MPRPIVLGPIARPTGMPISERGDQRREDAAEAGGEMLRAAWHRQSRRARPTRISPRRPAATAGRPARPVAAAPSAPRLRAAQAMVTALMRREVQAGFATRSGDQGIASGSDCARQAASRARARGQAVPHRRQPSCQLSLEDRVGQFGARRDEGTVGLDRADRLAGGVAAPETRRRTRARCGPAPAPARRRACRAAAPPRCRA